MGLTLKILRQNVLFLMLAWKLRSWQNGSRKAHAFEEIAHFELFGRGYAVTIRKRLNNEIDFVVTNTKSKNLKKVGGGYH